MNDELIDKDWIDGEEFEEYRELERQEMTELFILYQKEAGND